MNLLPVLINLKGRLAIVVGGGKIAELKIRSLLDSGAKILVVSPDLTQELSGLVNDGRIDYRDGSFVDSDLDGAWLAIAATDDTAVNERVFRAAEQRRILCNTVDNRELSSFITPAIVERGGILVAISTNGGSPALAQELKRVIGSAIGDEYVELLEIMRELRPYVQSHVSDQAERSRIFHSMVESEALGLLRQQDRNGAETLLRKIVDAAVDR